MEALARETLGSGTFAKAIRTSAPRVYWQHFTHNGGDAAGGGGPVVVDRGLSREAIILAGERGWCTATTLHGKTLWRTQIGGGGSQPQELVGHALVNGNGNGSTLVQATSHRLVSLHIDTGFIRFSAKLRKVRSAPVCVDDRIYLATSEGVVAYSALDGKKEFVCAIKGGAFAVAAHHDVGDDVYFLGCKGVLGAIDVHAEEIRWSASADATSPPSVDANHVYVTSGGHVVAYRRDDGTVVWETTLDDGVMKGALVLGSDRILAATAHALVAIDKTSGELLWAVNTAAAIANTAIFDDMIVGVTEDNTLRAFDLMSGRRLWMLEGIESFSGAVPAVTQDGMIVVQAGGGLLSLL